ncbi:unnamed protein product [Caenorhabditis sp. 36 PRJEB53466]|nr:unnamed protein product [Caenorhabditis sp. 36 PRJEB53466]
MDGLFRLFCGCCGLQTDPEPPYAELRHNSVTPVRDPPIQIHNGRHQQYQQMPPQYQSQHQPVLPPHQQHGFDNPVHNYGYDATDSMQQFIQNQHPHNGFSGPPSPPRTSEFSEQKKEEANREKELLDTIVENTQHSIIPVGQTDIDGMVMVDTMNREKSYKSRAQKMAAHPPAVQPYETVYEFEVDSSQTPIQVPTRYDEVSSTIESAPIDRMPFSCPDFNTMKLARPMGTKNPQFLAEHPDVKRIGRNPAISPSMKQRITEALDEVHHGVLAVEVEPRDLVVSMDF